MRILHVGGPASNAKNVIDAILELPMTAIPGNWTFRWSPK